MKLRLFFALLPFTSAASAQTGSLKPESGNPSSAVSVAAAANLVFALEALNAEFKKSEPDLALRSTTATSGALVAQIKQGAPVDVFLSADLDYPRALVANGFAEEKSLQVFATGKLVLWTTRPGLKLDSVSAVVRDAAVMKIALTNPATAPYGRAARQALEKLGVWEDVRPKLVVSEAISPTIQLVESGQAEIGFIALAVVLSPNLKAKSHWIEVPAALHAPLDHGAVLTNRGAANPAAARYLAFLSTPAARKILQDFGYALPPKL